MTVTGFPGGLRQSVSGTPHACRRVGTYRPGSRSGVREPRRRYVLPVDITRTFVPPASDALIRDWRSAEHACTAWMTRHGWPDATVTPPGADGGIDVTARNAAAQVKRQQKSVGRPALQRLRGAAPDPNTRLLFFTSSGYSPAAIEFARTHHMGLYTYTPTGTFHTVVHGGHVGHVVTHLDQRSVSALDARARCDACEADFLAAAKLVQHHQRTAQTRRDRRRVKRAADIMWSVRRDATKFETAMGRDRPTKALRYVPRIEKAAASARSILVR